MREHDLLAIYSILELCPLLLLSSRSLVLTTAGRESTKARLTSGWRYQRATWSGQAPASYHRPRGKPSKAGPWNGCDEIVECSRDWRCRHPLYTPPGEGLAVVLLAGLNLRPDPSGKASAFLIVSVGKLSGFVSKLITISVALYPQKMSLLYSIVGTPNTPLSDAS